MNRTTGIFRMFIVSVAGVYISLCSITLHAIEDEHFGLPAGGNCKIRLEPDEELSKFGYALDEQTMKRILSRQHHDVGAHFAALRLIAKRKYASLIPDVKAYHAGLDQKELGPEGRRMLAIEVLFTIDSKLAVAERDQYLKEVRYALLERPMPQNKNPPNAAFHTLIAARVYQGTDIENDLKSLIGKGRLSAVTHLPIRCLFKYYGDHLSENQMRSILEGLKVDSANYNLFLSLAHKLGKLMDLQISKKR